MSTTVAPPRVDAPEDTQVDEWAAEHSDLYAGWWCIRTDPYPCPAEGCPFVARFVTAAHMIVVWPSRDDGTLLSVARDSREAGRNPHVVEYEPEFGFAIGYDAWLQMGRPVHGVAPMPDQWEERTRQRL